MTVPSKEDLSKPVWPAEPHLCPAVPKNSLIVYIHGKGGSAAECEHYRALFPACDVLGLEYKAETPWEARLEFPALFDRLRAGYAHVFLIANSIGAFFSMHTLADKAIERAWFISPIVDMERLISDMMTWAGVTEQALEERSFIETDFGETLSWEYLCYVRSHPVRWNIPTDILYGGQDTLTARETITAFAAAHHAALTILENGEHWFNTPEQMAFLDRWVQDSLK